MGHKRYELYLCGAIQILITMPGLHCMVKVYTRCIPVQLFASTSAGETRLSSFSCRLRRGSPVGPLCSPLPRRSPHPIPVTRETHLNPFAYRADTGLWLARWKQPASGRPYQWRQCCVTHRERTSCSTTLLLFLFQTAAIALSFFSPPPPPPPL